MKNRLLTLVALAAIVVLSVALLSATAGSRQDEDDADGVWCYTPHLDELTFYSIGDYSGEKAFASTVETGEWTGTFAGTSKDYGFLVLHASGPTLFIATVAFDSVEVGGASGGLEMDVVGDRPDGYSDWEGTWVITSATGELADLQGSGTWWGPGWQGNPEECGVIYYSVLDMDGVDIEDDQGEDD